MNKITESAIEKFAIKLLEKLGYQYIYAPSIAPDSDSRHSQIENRKSYEDVLLIERLQAAVGRINPSIPMDIREDAIKQIQRLNSPELIANNEAFHRMLTEGIKVSYQKDGNTQGDLVWLIDFKNPENNDFLVANQFTVIENNVNKRPDVILFVNGLPLVVIEIKNPADENATVKSAFKQLQTYKQTIPILFTYNGLMIISDGLEAKIGSISAGFTRFMAWKTADGKVEASPLIGQLETLIKGILDKKTLLDLIRHFIVFEKSKKEDKKTSILTIQTLKKLASYHQYYAVNRAIESTLRASGYAETKNEMPNSLMIKESPKSYGVAGVDTQPVGDRKGGVVWHTQGSGKSLTMVFYTGKIVLTMDNPTVVIINDRNDLDDQLFDTFASSKQLLRQEPVQAEDRGQLKKLLKVASGGVVFTTIQKFQPEEGNIYETLSERKNVIVIADEAHRTQYGFKAKTIDAKDKNGNVVGKKIVYGFAKYMRDALPNATYIGFTGTPIESTDINTPAVFGNYVDVYDILQAVEDEATVRIFYESRLAKVNLSEEGKKLIADLDEGLKQGELTETQKIKWTQLETLIGSENRIKQVAQDIINHFEQRQEVFEGKAMIVSMSRRIAANLYKKITKIKPGWHNDDLKKALSFYSDSGGKGDLAIAQVKAVKIMLEKLEIVSQMFHGFAYEDYFEADTGKKLSLILAAEEHILGLENGKKRYINEVAALSQAFAIAIPHEQAMDVKDEVIEELIELTQIFMEINNH